MDKGYPADAFIFPEMEKLMLPGRKKLVRDGQVFKN
jgi:hypothetical protein